MDRIWITGVNGHVGSAIKKKLNLMEYRILGTDKKDVDVTKEEDVRLFADRNRPGIIINCAGYTDIEACERNKEEAFRVNALGARNLSVVARKMGARLIQISTDDVFGGNQTEPYNEFDVPVPITIYGKSKLAGENFVRELAPKHLIIRSSWVYGLGFDFVAQVLSAANHKNSMYVAADQFAAPTSAEELAKTIVTLMEKQEDGIFHVVCSGSCSRQEFAEEILKISGKHLTLIPTSNSNSMRPSYTVLDNLMLRILNIEEPKHWKEALKDYVSTQTLDERI